MELGPAFRTAGPWRLEAYQPPDPTGDAPARLCFTGPDATGAAEPDCTDLTATVEGVSVIYPLQTIDSIEVGRIPTRSAGGSEPALLVHASFSGGGSGSLRKLFVWTYERYAGTAPGHGAGGFFLDVFSSVVGDGGEQRFILSGPLAGSFIATDQVYIAGPTLADPQPYAIRVYRRAQPGFVELLGMLTATAYPTIRGGEPLAHPIDAELPLIIRALAAVYPRGLPR